MTSVFNKSAEALTSLADALQQLPDQNSYTNPCEALSNATIGQHTRHIIELYQCLLAGYAEGKINYDGRKRNPLYENDIAAAIDEIRQIQNKLEQPDKELSIFCGTNDHSVCIESNYYREVLYNLEHCIHHQALIKVALLSHKNINIAEGFGVAPSTLQYRRECAQ
ncbi:MAG: hypothetical protein JNM14_14145 [Ferruginibacter sp.]|nr:hypothetical protein [Ferruginibacter sp.]